MDGDFSLSRSLGGLRIANPDDSSENSSDNSPTPPPPVAHDDDDNTRSNSNVNSINNPTSLASVAEEEGSRNVPSAHSQDHQSYLNHQQHLYQHLSPASANAGAASSDDIHSILNAHGFGASELDAAPLTISPVSSNEAIPAPQFASSRPRSQSARANYPSGSYTHPPLWSNAAPSHSQVSLPPANLLHHQHSQHVSTPSHPRSPNLYPQAGYPMRFDSTISLDRQLARSHSQHLPPSAAANATAPTTGGPSRQYYDANMQSPTDPNALQSGLPPRQSSRHAVQDMRMGRSPPTAAARMPRSPYGSVHQPPPHAQQPPPAQLSAHTQQPRASPQPPPQQQSEDWKDRGAAVGITKEIGADGKPVSRYVKKGVRDFAFGRTLGEGSYSTVIAATDRQTLKEYAVKILDKRHIIKEKKVKYVNIEKDTLNRLTDHPGVVRLYYTFQDERSLYFVLDLANNGELLGVLKKYGTFDEECTRFYGAQILDTIHYMHRHDVIHRDLKPENVLLDERMHVKITDFGTAKILSSKNPKSETSSSTGRPADAPPSPESQAAELADERASSFVGTAEYVSPELLMEKCACKASDLWAFGCIIYQLLAGRPPFKAANEYLTFQKIMALKYEFPPGFPRVARDLVERLLVLDPAERPSIDQIKAHDFFHGVVWGRGLWKQKTPRLRPYVPPNEPIRLDSGPAAIQPTATAPAAAVAASGSATAAPTSVPKPARPHPRVITNLAPPSQLDIEWSPVLTHSNERILKLGNLVVVSSPPQHSHHGHHGGGDSQHAAEQPIKKFRLFGGTTTKKRQRLVIVTSAGRIVIVPTGGEEKKIKMEISLLAPRVTYRVAADSKGNSMFVVDTKDKHYVFADADTSSSSTFNPQEWIDSLDRAKEQATFQTIPDDTTPSSPTGGVGAPLGVDVDSSSGNASAARRGSSNAVALSVPDTDRRAGSSSTSRDTSGPPLDGNAGHINSGRSGGGGSGVSGNGSTANLSMGEGGANGNPGGVGGDGAANAAATAATSGPGPISNGPAAASLSSWGLVRHAQNKDVGDSESTKTRKRFSRRHSKNGLAAVF